MRPDLVEVFCDVSQLPPESRASRLVELCGADELLRGEVEQLLRQEDKPAAPVVDPTFVHPGTAVARRYVIIDRIGEGGMGAVYSAYDRELDRKVALKFLARLAPSGGATGADARLRREAQALARVRHPHVIAVHDVADFDGHLFFAMDFVDGPTLREWISECDRHWREVLDVMLAAARGLLAVHRSGLVHLDFKPSNVMLSDEAHVVLMDFGLARLLDEHTLRQPSGPDDAEIARGTGLDSCTRSMPNRFGTPAYMAPEQHRGEAVDVRTDVFSYCALLYECLCGVQPYSAVTSTEFLERKAAKEITRPPRASTPPRWLYEIVMRGLEPDPRARWQSMSELIAALRKDPTSRRRLLVSAGGLCAAAGTIYLHEVANLTNLDRACRADSLAIAQIWTPQARASTADVVRSTPGGEAVWSALEANVDAYVEAWAAASYEVCHETRIDRTRSEDDLQRSATCLDELRVTADTLLELVRDGQPAHVFSGSKGVAKLRPPAICTEAEMLEHSGREMEAAAAPIIRDLAQADALSVAATEPRAITLATAALDQARALGDEVLIARSYRSRGSALIAVGAFEEGLENLEQAFYRAGGAAADDIALHAANDLAYALGVLDRLDEADQWLRIAKMLAERLNLPSAHPQVLHMHNSAGSRFYEAGRYEEAAHEFAAARDALEESPRNASPLDLAVVADNLGAAMTGMGQVAEAAEHHERALEIRRVALGPRHPEVGMTLHNIAASLFSRGEYRGALEQVTAALQLFQDAYGDAHPQVAVMLATKGQILSALGDPRAALDQHFEALRIRRGTLGEDHTDVARSLNSIGTVQCLLGDHRAALQAWEEALATLERAEHPHRELLLLVLMNLGDEMRDFSRLDQAVELHTRAAELADELPDPTAPGKALLSLGSDFHMLKQYRQAAEHFERSIRVFEESGSAEAEIRLFVATAKHNLGEAYAKLHRYPEALSAYAEAKVIFEAMEGSRASTAAQLIGIGNIHFELREYDKAEGYLREALLIRSEAATDLGELAVAQFALARVLQRSGKPSGESHALAKEAALNFDRVPPSMHADTRTELARWMKKNSAAPAGMRRRAVR